MREQELLLLGGPNHGEKWPVGTHQDTIKVPERVSMPVLLLADAVPASDMTVHTTFYHRVRLGVAHSNKRYEFFVPSSVYDPNDKGMSAYIIEHLIDLAMKGGDA